MISNDELDMRIDEFVADSRKMNGQIFQEREQWHSSATADAIRHHAYGISDDNPLWIDREYAGQGSIGKLQVPPTFVASVLYPGLHGAPMEVPLSSLIGELECTWFRPIVEGDELRGIAKQLEVFESKSRQGRRLVNILAEITYRNQHGEDVARAESLMVRVEQRDTELLTDRSIYTYTEDELQLIKKALESETRTGVHRLGSDQTEPGYQLEPLVRGPLTLGDLVCWQAAIGPSYRPGALGFRDCVDQPHTVAVNPVTGWPVKYSQQHEDTLMSRQRGMSAPFDNTVMRWAWISPLVTNWMGDHGFLKRLSISAVEPILYGDTNWYRGIITRRVVKDSGVTLVIRITGTSQRGVVTTTGEAEVEIPHHAIRPAADQSHQPENPVLQEREAVTPSAHALFERQVAVSPAALALVCNDQQLTYHELNKRSNKLAHHLGALGARPGDRVAVCVARSIDMVIGQLAILKAGGVYVPLDPELSGSRLYRMLEDTSTSILLTHQDIANVLSGSDTRPVLLDSDWGHIALRPDHNPRPEFAPDSLAYIMYTSGSLGTPKAAMIAHSSLLTYMDAISKEIPLRADDNYLYTASPCFSASIRQTMLPLCSGATLVIADSEQRRDPRLLFEMMRKYEVSIWDTVPSVWRQYVQVLAAMPEQDRRILLENRLRLILLTGEALRWETAHAWADEFGHKASIINLYSQTETSGTVCLYRVPDDSAEQDGVVPLGRAIDGAEVHLLDENLSPVASDEVGELCVTGERIAKGYLNNTTLTAEKFVRIPFGHGDGKVFYRTGDLARYGENDVLLYCGRRDHHAKLHGYRIELGEIESALGQHPALHRAVVVMRADAAGEDKLVAYAVTRDCALPRVEQLRAFLAETLPEYMVPHVFIEIDELPLTASGKVDRSALPTPKSSRPELESDFVSPRGPIEAQLVQIWEQLLGVSRIGVNDDFFALGGNSLSASRVVSRINETFGIELPVRQLLESPVIKAVAVEVFERMTNEIDESELSDLVTRITDSGSG